MRSHEELLESLERTLSEIEALEAIYGCGEEEGTQLFEVVSPPSALEQARALIFERNCDSKESVPDLEVKIMCQLDEDPLSGAMLMLRCRLPAGYPAQEAAKVTSISCVDRSILKKQSARESLTEALNQTAESLVGSEAVMELVECLKELAPKYYCFRNCPKEEQTKQTSTSAAATTKTPKLFVISSHHLLNHAPDNFLAKGGKYRLKGVYRFGTPGLGLVVGYNDNTLLDVENFIAALEKKMPQKKFEIALTRDLHQDGGAAIDDWEEATMDQLRELLTPDEFTTILNIQGASSSASSNNNSRNKSQHAKGKDGKRGK